MSPNLLRSKASKAKLNGLESGTQCNWQLSKAFFGSRSILTKLIKSNCVSKKKGRRKVAILQLYWHKNKTLGETIAEFGDTTVFCFFSFFPSPSRLWQRSFKAAAKTINPRQWKLKMLGSRMKKENFKRKSLIKIKRLFNTKLFKKRDGIRCWMHIAY